MELLDLLVRYEDSDESCIPRHLCHDDAHGLFQLGLYRSTEAVAHCFFEHRRPSPGRRRQLWTVSIFLGNTCLYDFTTLLVSFHYHPLALPPVFITPCHLLICHPPCTSQSTSVQSRILSKDPDVGVDNQTDVPRAPRKTPRSVSEDSTALICEHSACAAPLCRRKSRAHGLSELVRSSRRITEGID